KKALAVRKEPTGQREQQDRLEHRAQVGQPARPDQLEPAVEKGPPALRVSPGPQAAREPPVRARLVAPQRCSGAQTKWLVDNASATPVISGNLNARPLLEETSNSPRARCLPLAAPSRTFRRKRAQPQRPE